MKDVIVSDVFERILIDYGAYILICVRNVFQENEAYERCAEINKVLQRHNISTFMTKDEWLYELQSSDENGESTIKMAPCHFLDALEMCKNAGMLDGLY